MCTFSCEDPFVDSYLMLKPEMLQSRLNRVNFLLLNIYAFEMLNEWLKSVNRKPLMMRDCMFMATTSLILCCVFFPFVVALAYFLACGYYKEALTFALTYLLRNKIRTWLSELYDIAAGCGSELHAGTKPLERQSTMPLQTASERPGEYRKNVLHDPRPSVTADHMCTYYTTTGHCRSNIVQQTFPYSMSSEKAHEQLLDFRRNQFHDSRPNINADALFLRQSHTMDQQYTYPSQTIVKRPEGYERNMLNERRQNVNAGTMSANHVNTTMSRYQLINPTTTEQSEVRRANLLNEAWPNENSDAMLMGYLSTCPLHASTKPLDGRRRSFLTESRSNVNADTMPVHHAETIPLQTAREQLEEFRRNGMNEAATSANDSVNPFPGSLTTESKNIMKERGDSKQNKPLPEKKRVPDRRRRVVYPPPVKMRTRADSRREAERQKNSGDGHNN